MPNFLLPLVILVAAIAGARFILDHPPSAARSARQVPAALAVETLTLERQPYQVVVESFGMVAPRTQSLLVAQVGGQIVEVSAQFQDGGFFRAGDRLLTIDPRDYAAAVTMAEANLVGAEQALVEEQARAAQALRDWQRLGDGDTAPGLVIRQPQLRAAQAAVDSAEAALVQARLALERTAVVAPYAGRIRVRRADRGQVVAANTTVAEIYATDVVEVALPLTQRDLAFVDLPEQRRRVDQPMPAVELRSELPPHASWQAQLVRTEGAIDEATRQLRVVAQIDSPYADPDAPVTIKIGEYVTARIEGRRIADALVIPNQAIYESNYVYVLDDGVLARRPIEIAWRNDVEALIGAGLDSGDALVLTPLGRVSSGTRARAVPARELSRTPAATAVSEPDMAAMSAAARP